MEEKMEYVGGRDKSKSIIRPFFIFLYVDMQHSTLVKHDKYMNQIMISTDLTNLIFILFGAIIYQYKKDKSKSK